jgi:DNA-binding MarR family transcriptional regulator
MESGERKALDIWRDINTRTIKADGPDLSARQTALLLTVHLDEERYTVRELSKRLGLGKPAIVRALDSLQAMGLLRRVRDPNDKRSVLIEPTLEGSEKLNSIAQILYSSFSSLGDKAAKEFEPVPLYQVSQQLNYAAQ